MKLGIYRYHEFLSREELAGYEQLVQARITILSCYRAWGDCRPDADRSWLENVSSLGRELLITWEPWLLPSVSESHPEIQKQFRLSEILSGRYERYIRDFAGILGQLENRVYLRPMHEMNGCWYPWCGTVNGNSPEQFLEVWAYLRSIFMEEGVDQVEWVWSPYTRSYPSVEKNQLQCYLPGDDQIDWVALDGYNWGSSRPECGWESFSSLFRESYYRLSQLSTKPFMLAEVATGEDGGEKADWIRAMGTELDNGFERVKSLIWFDHLKECDWRIESSRESLDAFRQIGHLFPAVEI